MIVDLHLKGGLVIVVGGGAEGLKKVNSLLTQDCKILVVSDKVNSNLSKYVKQKKITLKKSKLKNADFLSKYKPILVIAATNNRELNKKIIQKAKKMKCYVFSSDNPEESDFSNPSIINIENAIQIAISTGGKSPIIAKKLKNETEKIFKKAIKKEDIYQIKLQQIARDTAKKTLSSQLERKKFLYSLINDKSIKQLIKDKNLKKAQQRAKAMLKEWK